MIKTKKIRTTGVMLIACCGLLAASCGTVEDDLVGSVELNVDEINVDVSSSEGNDSTSLPSTTLPSTTLPSTTLPSTTLPSTTLPPPPPLPCVGEARSSEANPVGTLDNGEFILGVQTDEVYVIAGGAPLYVSDWQLYGGKQPFGTVDQADIDGTSAPTYLRHKPADGTFIAGIQTGEVYVIAGGAPLYVSDWATYSQKQPVVEVDQIAIDRAGDSGRWSHLRAQPADCTFLSAGQTGRVYVVKDGIAHYVESWEPYGGKQQVVVVDQAAIDNAGTGGRWDHLAGAS